MAPRLTYGEYAKMLRRMAKNAPQVADSLVKDLARRVDYTLVMATPIDTGRARSNWSVGIDRVLMTYKHPKPKKPSSPEAGIQEALEQGYNAIARYKGSGVIFITNNAPYIKWLNTGPRPGGFGSPQAPAFFIESAIANARESLRSHKKGFSSALMTGDISRLGGFSGPIVPVAIKPAVALAKKSRRGR